MCTKEIDFWSNLLIFVLACMSIPVLFSRDRPPSGRQWHYQFLTQTEMNVTDENKCAKLFFFIFFSGLWNLVFLFSNLSLVFLMPFAYFFTESEGFAGSKKVQHFFLPCIWQSLVLQQCCVSMFCGCVGSNGKSV